MKFKTVAEYFQKLEGESSRLAMTELLADLLRQATPAEASIIVNFTLGQLHPVFIGTQFGLAEKSLIPIVASVLNRSESSVEKERKKLGDIGQVLGEGVWHPDQELTVTQVYDALCKIEQTSGTGSQEKKADLLHDLLISLEPVSAKYAVRIVAGKLRLGFSDMTVVDALSWMETGDKSLRAIIEDAYNIRVDIGAIAKLLKEDGIEALEKLTIEVGTPIRPAAAERLPSAKAIFEKIGPCVAQPKFDGFRLQVHIDKSGEEPAVHFFSRNLQDMTGMFPDLHQAALELDVESLICEGEAIAYDAQTGSFLPFQETVRRKRKHGIEEMAEEFPLKLFLFDLLYLNGKSLLDETHLERRTKLTKAVGKTTPDSVVQVTQEKEIGTAQELEEYFMQNIAAGLDALVVKRPDAIYQPGKRNFNWIKLKRQEEGQLEDTIDCVILGYYTGSGRRAGFGIGAFLVGVYNKNEDVFQTIAKIGTGLSDEGWRELKEKCDAVAVKTKPNNVVCAKELVPDVWCAPEIVCAVRADEITQSPTHSAGKTDKELGFALRFPRIMAYRDDKGPFDATTVAEVKTLYKHQFGRS